MWSGTIHWTVFLDFNRMREKYNEKLQELYITGYSQVLVYLRGFAMRDDDDVYRKAYAEAKAKLDAKADKDAEEAGAGLVGIILIALVVLAIWFFAS